MGTPENSETQSEMVMAEIVATPVSGGESASGPAVSDTGSGISGPGMTSRGSSTSRASSPTSVTNLILPLAGLGLIAVGILLALSARKRGTPKAE